MNRDTDVTVNQSELEEIHVATKASISKLQFVLATVNRKTTM